MFELGDNEFEEMVEAAIEHMPDQFISELDNVCFAIQDEPELWQLENASDPTIAGGTYEGGELLGLYEGVSLPERANGYDMDLPDMITIFKGPHERLFGSRDIVAKEIEKTVIHEIGHYFGLDDRRLHEMGY